MKNQVAWNFKQSVTYKKQSGSQGIGAGGNPYRGLQGLFDKANVGAIEKGNDIHQKQEGN